MLSFSVTVSFFFYSLYFSNIYKKPSHGHFFLVENIPEVLQNVCPADVSDEMFFRFQNEGLLSPALNVAIV